MKRRVRPARRSRIISSHTEVASALRQEILADLRPGRKVPGLRKIAARFNVSYGTVQKSLLLLTGEGLLESRHGSGTYVRGRADARHVGVLLQLDFAAPRTSYFWRRVTQQLRDELRGRGLPVRLYLGRNPPGELEVIPCEEFLADVAADKLSGVAVAYGWADPAWCEPLKRRGVPVVGPANVFDYGAQFDWSGWISQAVLRLFAAGRRRIGLMRWAATDDGNAPDVALETFTQSLSAFGVLFRREWLRGNIHPSKAGAGWEEFREIWTASRDKPDGLIVCDEVLLESACPAIDGAGVRVPEQLMVVAQVSRGSGLELPFPVIRAQTDPDEYARVLADLLVRRMRGEQPPARVTLPLQWSDDLAPTIAHERPSELVYASHTPTRARADEPDNAKG
jgi:DNA-binding LacI/PurR family transcriptional regulator